MRFLVISLLALVSIGVIACGGSSEAEVEEYSSGAYHPVIVNDWSIDGKRDGAQTRANAVFELGDGRSLKLDLLLAYDPTPVLAQASWTLGSESGSVEALSVRFVGGQGDGPSVGGAYVLLQAGEPRFRVKLPLRKIDTHSYSF